MPISNFSNSGQNGRLNAVMDIEGEQRKSELELARQNENLLRQLPECLYNQLLKYSSAFQEDNCLDGSDEGFKEEAEQFKKESYKFVEMLARIKKNLTAVIEQSVDSSYVDLRHLAGNLDLFVTEVTEDTLDHKVKRIAREQITDD